MRPDPGVGARGRGRVRRRCGAPAAMAVLVAAVLLGGCGGSSPRSKGQEAAYLNEVSGSAPGISSYRTNEQLVRLGQAVCDDFRSGASYETIADQLATTAGPDQLPAADLGAVITSAATNLCPRYESKLS